MPMIHDTSPQSRDELNRLSTYRFDRVLVAGLADLVAVVAPLDVPCLHTLAPCPSVKGLGGQKPFVLESAWHQRLPAPAFALEKALSLKMQLKCLGDHDESRCACLYEPARQTCKRVTSSFRGLDVEQESTSKPRKVMPLS